MVTLPKFIQKAVEKLKNLFKPTKKENALDPNSFKNPAFQMNKVKEETQKQNDNNTIDPIYENLREEMGPKIQKNNVRFVAGLTQEEATSLINRKRKDYENDNDLEEYTPITGIETIPGNNKKFDTSNLTKLEKKNLSPLGILNPHQPNPDAAPLKSGMKAGTQFNTNDDKNAQFDTELNVSDAEIDNKKIDNDGESLPDLFKTSKENSTKNETSKTINPVTSTQNSLEEINNKWQKMMNEPTNNSNKPER